MSPCLRWERSTPRAGPGATRAEPMECARGSRARDQAGIPCAELTSTAVPDANNQRLHFERSRRPEQISRNRASQLGAGPREPALDFLISPKDVAQCREHEAAPATAVRRQKR